MHDQARRGYGTAGAAAAYERGRPGYPGDAVAELVRVLGIAPGATVLDLAAGTGKLTRQLLATGATLVAAEPVAAMRAQLARLAAGGGPGGPEPGHPAGGPGPGLQVLGGTAEAIPLRDGSLDAVTVGQAFHWFDAGRAVAELGRVLRPGGRLALIWNARDESQTWVAEVTAILDRHAGDAPRYRDGRWRAAFDTADRFTPLRHRTFRHVHQLDRAAVLDRFASISFVAALPDAARARVLDEIDRVIAAEPSLAGRDRIGLPYRTDLWWCERRGGNSLARGEPRRHARDMLVALWTGLGLGFLVAAQVGPIWLLCARSVLRGRLVTGLAIGAGAALVDLAYACLGVAGAAQLLRVTGLRLALGLVGTAVLVALGGQRRHWSTATARHLLEIRPRRHRLLPAKAAERAGPVRGVAWHSLLPQAADLLARRRSPALMVTSADHRQPRPAA